MFEVLYNQWFQFQILQFFCLQNIDFVQIASTEGMKSTKMNGFH